MKQSYPALIASSDSLPRLRSGFHFDMLKLSLQSHEMDLNATLIENRIAKMDSDQQKILKKIEKTRQQAKQIIELRTEKQLKEQARQAREEEQ